MNDEITARRRVDRAADLARWRPAGPQGTPTRIRGTVEKLDGQALTVKSREGQTVTIALADNVAVAYLVKKNVGDIKPGDNIASTGIKGTEEMPALCEIGNNPEDRRIMLQIAEAYECPGKSVPPRLLSFARSEKGGWQASADCCAGFGIPICRR